MNVSPLHWLYRGTLNLLFPPQCAGCALSGTVLCSRCMQSIQPLTPPYCPRCLTLLATPEACCRPCTERISALRGLRAVGSYTGVLLASIHALKYQGVIELADPLGKLLAQTYQRHHLQADIVLPVPLHPERQRQRGFNQATLLARACARQLGIPWDERLLIRRRATSSQVGLTASERRANVAAAFSLPSSTRRIRERTILLIDDVSTTGATLEACARPLLDAGAQAVWGLVLAKRNFAHERSRNASRSLSFR